MIKKQYVGYFSIIFSIIFPYIFEKAFFPKINIDVYMWGVIFCLFISLHFFIEIKKIWDFIYKKRWFLCFGICLIVLLLEYNTSSIGMYNHYIQPNHTSENYEPIFGYLKAIRSDEWASSTPLKISQYKLNNPFSTENDIIMAKKNIVALYPNLPVKSISALTMPRFWGYLLFDEAKGLTVDTMFEWIFLIFVSFEFMMIITRQKKLYSLCGAVILAFAPAIIWWTGYNTILYGQAIVVMVHSFVHSKSKWSKLVKSVIIGWLISCDIMTLYPAWLVPFTYIYFIMVLYLLFKNTKKQDILFTIMCIVLAFSIGIGLMLPGYFSSKDTYDIINNTVYPGQRFSIGGGRQWESLLNYIYALFLWFKPTANASESSQFIGFFPIPIIIGMIYSAKRIYRLFKEKENKTLLKQIDWLLIGLTSLAILFTIDSFFPIPFLAKITFLYMSPVPRLAVALNYLSLIILFRYLTTTEKRNVKIKNSIVAIIFGILLTGILLSIFKGFNSEYITLKIGLLITLLFSLFLSFILLNYKKTNIAFFIVLASCSFISGVCVNPISKGISILHEKPLAKKIQEIVKENRNAIWISLNNSFVIGNYMAANGAKTINTTNMVPNIKLWEKFPNFEQYNEVFNRYAYFMIAQTTEKSNFYLHQPDLMTLFLNFNDLKIMEVDYIVTSQKLEDKSDKISLNLIYSEDGQNIYQVNYN